MNGEFAAAPQRDDAANSVAMGLCCPPFIARPLRRVAADSLTKGPKNGPSYCTALRAFGISGNLPVLPPPALFPPFLRSRTTKLPHASVFTRQKKRTIEL